LLSSAPAEADFNPAHTTLDRAVWSAYGWPGESSQTADDETIPRRLLELNLEQGNRERQGRTGSWHKREDVCIRGKRPGQRGGRSTCRITPRAFVGRPIS
jgi:hypothetical protein